MKLSIYHDGQFFVGLVKYNQSKKSKFVKYTFGKEPDYDEILWFIDKLLLTSLDKTKTTVNIKKSVKRVNPKRLQRQVAKEQKQHKNLTKAHEAIKVEQELNKKERKIKNKTKRDVLKEKKRRIKQLKAKEKHKRH
ncbi:YjdF family protein [Staphylococcus felis]|uniref:YjdF family protein n=1 Tax=Staphylococcus felis TaxID=46127 RepID=UPI0024814CDA|nr:YjdF family protein [Staphylococcus felis]MDQ7192713.1 YjdF family protein [Staphylococcus felis]